MCWPNLGQLEALEPGRSKTTKKSAAFLGDLGRTEIGPQLWLTGRTPEWLKPARLRLPQNSLQPSNRPTKLLRLSREQLRGLRGVWRQRAIRLFWSKRNRCRLPGRGWCASGDPYSEPVEGVRKATWRTPAKARLPRRRIGAFAAKAIANGLLWFAN